MAGSLVWGAAMGIQESTLRHGRGAGAQWSAGDRLRAVAGVVGVASLVSGALTGGLYDYSIPVLITVVVAIQVLALVLLAVMPASRR